MKTIPGILVILLTFFQARAQEVEMASGLRSSGKIYVVVIVIAVIFIGLIAYLFSIDRRVKKLENREDSI
ncbi:CcmD family protein [Pedobacter sp. P351]|uniref:CcmD family protein n=1 Tax=Pedobacter superstes TaxID=3133441 RepID=UPI0030A60769